MECVNGHQLDIFDLMAMGMFTSSSEKKHDKSRLKVSRKAVAEVSSDDDYIAKGERILTLARDAFSKVMKRFEFSSLEERIFSVPFNEKENLESHVRKLAKALRPIIADMDFSEGSTGYAQLRSLIDQEIEISPAQETVYAVKKLKTQIKKDNDILRLRVMENGWPAIECYGYRKQNAGKKDYLFTDESSVADISLLLSHLIVLSVYNRAIKDPDVRAQIAEELSRKGYNGKFAMFQALGSWLLVGEEGKYLDNQEIVDLMSSKPEGIVITLNRSDKPEEWAIEEFMKQFGLKNGAIGLSKLDRNELRKENRKVFKESDHKEIFQLELTKAIACGLIGMYPIQHFERGLGSLSYNETLIRASRKGCSRQDNISLAWPLPRVSKMGAICPMDVIMSVIKTVWEEKGQVVNKLRYYREMSSKPVAKPYQTKKGIPKKVLKEMRESVFNNYFGYVEIDESCGLEKVRAIADEFTSFKDKLMPGFDSKAVALRFRRIGNHKALGIYYPMLGCLVVDVSSPSSFLHEYGHCLDNLQGGSKQLSEQAAFYHTYCLYKDALIASLGDEGAESMRKSNSKYNLSYYLLNTEAFARCFEMYLVRVLKLNSSLCKQEEGLGWAYPDDDELMESVKTYFDALFETINRGTSDKYPEAA